MFGVRHRRRRTTTSFVVAGLAVVVGAIGLPAVQVEAEIAGGPPPLAWPDVAPEVPAAPSEPEGALAVPADWAEPVPKVARRPADQPPTRARELVEQRTAVREVWENTDGTLTAILHSEPAFYQPGAPGAGARTTTVAGAPTGAASAETGTPAAAGTRSAATASAAGWEPIDTSLVPDPGRAGWLRTAANAWTASFGPIEPGAVGGVEMETSAGKVRVVPDLAEGHAVNGPVSGTIAPVAGTAGAASTVTYADVWPGVDLVYEMSGGNLRQNVVLRDAGCESVRFVVEGLGLAETPAAQAGHTLEVTGGQSGLLGLQPLDVVVGAGKPADPSAAPAMRLPEGAADLVGDDPDVPGEPQFLAVSVAGAWLDRTLHAGEGPVTVGSTTNVGSTALDALRFRGDPAQPGDPNAEILTYHDGLRVGRPSGAGQPLWRTAGRYEYGPFVEGRQVLQARLMLGGRADANPYSVDTFVRSATDASFGGAAGDTVDLAQVTVEQGRDDIPADVTDLLHRWQREGRTDGVVGLVGEEDSSVDSFLRFDRPVLEITVNSVPPPPALQGPSPDARAIATTTPVLSWAPVEDPDGDPVTYTARIATGPDGDSGLVVTSPSGPATSWPVPAGVLRDGTTYFWKVFATDGRAWTPSEIRRITVQRGLGAAPRPAADAAAPTDVVGAMTTNLVTGNGMLRVPGSELPSVSGGVGVDLVHNSLASRTGLLGVYREDANRNTEIDRTDPIRLVRTDAQLSLAWPSASASPAPAPGVPREWYSTQWSGRVTLPPGNWRIGARSDDGVRIRLDGTTILEHWEMGAMPARPAFQDGSVAGGSGHDIEVDHFQAFEGAGFELWARKADAAPDDPAAEIVVPAAWLSSAPPGLPAGWTLAAADLAAPYTHATVAEGTVTLYARDGAARAYTKTVGAPIGGGSGAPAALGAGGAGYRPPPGATDIVSVAVDGSVTVKAPGGVTEVFRPDGQLDRVTTAAGDGKPLAAQPAYDPSGRIERLTDPVSGRSTTFAYAPSPDCSEHPPIGGDVGGAPAGMLCRIAYWDGTSSELYYAKGLLAYVRNPGDAYWGFGYDGAGRLTSYVDPLAFDASLAGVPDVAAFDHVVAYDDAGRVASVARPPTTAAADARRTRSYTYAPNVDASGELVAGTTTVTRNSIGTPFRTIGYDPRGRLVDDDATHITWDDQDRAIAVDAPDGLRTTTTFDDLGRPAVAWGPAPAASFNPDGTGGDDVPRTTTGFDEGLEGLTADYFGNPDLVGGPAVHGFRPGTLATKDWGTAAPVAGIPADNWSARLSGDLVFPAPGPYKLRLYKDGQARLFLDDQLLVDAWDSPSGWSGDVEVTAAAPNEAHRLRVDFAKRTGPAGLELLWTAPGAEAPESVPATVFQPAFDLPTTTVDPDGVTTRVGYRDDAAGLGPEHRRAVQTIVDPEGLHLVSSVGFEPPGSGHLRPVSRTRPAGPETTATTAYYGDAELRDNPCTRAGDRANQAGLVHFETSADPDGDGPRPPLVHEAVYGTAGRPVATRVVGDDTWTCTSYDGRGRVSTVAYAAKSDGQAARTVTTTYGADPDGAGPLVASPLVTAVADPAGTLVTQTNVLGDTVASTDVFGNTATTSYDPVGRAIEVRSRAGALSSTYDDDDRLVELRRDGLLVASDLVYDPAGRLTGIGFPAGGTAAGAAGNGTTGALGYDPSGRPATATWSGTGGVVTADVVARRAGGGVLDHVVGAGVAAGDPGDHHPGDDYAYDGAGRLVEAWVPGQHLSYQFAVQDGCGPLVAAGADDNRTHQRIEGGPVTCYCYDRADRLVAADTATGEVTFDPHGNVTAMFGERRGYDPADRLVEVVQPAGATVTYVRDALGRIVERSVGGAVVARYGYVGESAMPAFTTDGAGTLLDAVIPLPGGVLMTVRADGSAVWSYPDMLGDLVAGADQSGAPLGPPTTYDPFGNVVAGALPDTLTGNLDYVVFAGRALLLEHEPTLQPTADTYVPILGRKMESLTFTSA
jgi:YD repeat-containing protein